MLLWRMPQCASLLARNLQGLSGEAEVHAAATRIKIAP